MDGTPLQIRPSSDHDRVLLSCGFRCWDVLRGPRCRLRGLRLGDAKNIFVFYRVWHKWELTLARPPPPLFLPPREVPWLYGMSIRAWPDAGLAVTGECF